jgi:ribosomal protein S18 acetylase RimI-like enzyme
MPWAFSDQVDDYAEHASGLLNERPVENTIALTMIETLRAGRRWSSEPMLFGWYDAGPGEAQPSGAISITPPYELLLSVVPDGTVDELVAALRGRGVRLPGVNADDAPADRFAAAWTAGTALHAEMRMHTRLYALRALEAVTPAPPGRPRRAVEADGERATAWFAAFQTEAGAHEVDAGSVVRYRIANGLMWVWELDDGEVVSLAGRNAAAAGVSRVGPVYTPPEHRRRGYGAAVTAACTADALAGDAEHVVLFTDLANPTSNSIYRRIGYRPVCDRKVIHFIG